MKIHQLPNGARFEYEGEVYVKTGPMFASGKGGQRLIPKYAVLKPLDASVPAQGKTSSDVSGKQAILAAFADFCAQCEGMIPAERITELEAAKQRFLTRVAAQ